MSFSWKRSWPDALPRLVHRCAKDAAVRVDIPEASLEVGGEAECRAWRRIPPVQQGMDTHRRHPAFGGEPSHLDQVPVVGMHAAGSQQADQVEASAGLGRPPARLQQRRPGREAAIGDRRIDPRQILQDRPPSTQVEVPNLRIAHLPGGQTDRIFGGAQDRVRPVTQQTPPGGHGGRGDRVRRWIVTDPEAIQDDEDDGSRAPRRRRGHTDPARAEAVSPARATIPAISSGLSDAPPTSAPSIDGSAMNSSIDADVTLPP